MTSTRLVHFLWLSLVAGGLTACEADTSATPDAFPSADSIADADDSVTPGDTQTTETWLDGSDASPSDGGSDGDSTTSGDTIAPDGDDADLVDTEGNPSDTGMIQDTNPTDSVQNDTFVQDTSTTDTTGDTGGPGDVGPEPVVDNGLNATWIGGACADAGDCDHPAFDQPAVCEDTGFPNGFCTQACRQSTTTGAWICPDADTSAATDFTTTRCISADGVPRCVAECDFLKSDTGCRPGYVCVNRPRHGQPDKVFPVCLPEPDQVWPGEALPADDIGEACARASDCEHSACLGLPGGYCTKSYCDTAGCPDGSTCFGFGAGDTACLRDCGEDGECRVADGYACDADGTCWPSDAAPTWDSSVGAADCLAAWGTNGSGLSSCDPTKDDYVVLHKSKRNLALCNKGNLVANYQMGLGFAPIGDKEVEGDGKTPEGVFYVAQLVPNSDYHLGLVFSYPDNADAARGITGGIITQAEKTAIESAQAQCKLPPQSTGLGGWIEIHGEGGDSDWTLGCAAIDNDAVETVYATLGLRDTIVVKP